MKYTGILSQCNRPTSSCASNFQCSFIIIAADNPSHFHRQSYRSNRSLNPGLLHKDFNTISATFTNNHLSATVESFLGNSNRQFIREPNNETVIHANYNRLLNHSNLNISNNRNQQDSKIPPDRIMNNIHNERNSHLRHRKYLILFLDNLRIEITLQSPKRCHDHATNGAKVNTTTVDALLSSDEWRRR